MVQEVGNFASVGAGFQWSRLRGVGMVLGLAFGAFHQTSVCG